MGVGDANAAGFIHGGTIMKPVDEDGRPTEVPPLEAVTPDERRREREAQLRRRNRLAERDAVRADRAAKGEPA